jgi:hypothetical protein
MLLSGGRPNGPAPAVRCPAAGPVRGYRHKVDEQQTPHPEQPGAESTVCSRCGAVAEGTPPAWTLSVENGIRRYYCDDCARANLRAIEGRLDSDWW